ncbi:MULTISPECIES: hypothetical protein [Rhizobium]|uniref:hypothetical protein n=1 Tax=Rhizobium TaxID=379 RepID=UPI000BE9037C|nr:MULTISPECIES: hypothetical protein [Rhizobium]MDF0659533.1 hypothetical protein [Rhizobium sp. BC49]MDR9781559.1 hypothetical protein [Rhizobium redzepovicii]PDS81727.1 hypothetical protein CO654_29200 [Rhizobium sp. L18]TBY45271.1 hypothetical protein E0H54_21935 [Rhizobium leguminosarum bv. viciae]ULJ79406.1 hypothetical protein MF410_04905 [Rhizobium sp. C104]
MKATAIKPYRCVCTECEPLRPIEGLHPLTHEGSVKVDAGRPKGLLGIIAKRMTAARRQN